MVLLAASAISIASTIPSWAVLHLSFLTNVSFGQSLLAQANDVFLVFTLLASITLSECVQTNFCHVLGAMKLTEQLMSGNAIQRDRNSPCSWPLFSMREAVEDVLTPYSAWTSSMTNTTLSGLFSTIVSRQKTYSLVKSTGPETDILGVEILDISLLS